jgi:nicotinamidase-related amidase
MSSIDPGTSALLVLHYQNGLVRHDGIFAFSGTAAQVEKHVCLDKTARVIQASRAAGIAVAYVNIEFRPGFPELKKPTYPLIESIQERNSSAFSHTDLDCILRAKGVESLYLTGIATNWVVESTARYGAELGYDITVLSDCCQGFSDELHDFAIKNTLPYYGSVIESNEYLSLLEGVAQPA